MVKAPGASSMRAWRRKRGHPGNTDASRVVVTRNWTSPLPPLPERWRQHPNSDGRRAAVTQFGRDEVCTPRSRVPEVHYWPASPRYAAPVGPYSRQSQTQPSRADPPDGQRLELPCEDGACIVHCYFELPGIPPYSPLMVERPVSPCSSRHRWLLALRDGQHGMEDALQLAGMLDTTTTLRGSLASCMVVDGPVSWLHAI